MLALPRSAVVGWMLLATTTLAAEVPCTSARLVVEKRTTSQGRVVVSTILDEIVEGEQLTQLEGDTLHESAPLGGDTAARLVSFRIDIAVTTRRRGVPVCRVGVERCERSLAVPRDESPLRVDTWWCRVKPNEQWALPVNLADEGSVVVVKWIQPAMLRDVPLRRRTLLRHGRNSLL